MCQTNNASMEDVRKAEVECLRKKLAEKDDEIKHLHDLLDVYDREQEEQYDRWIKETRDYTENKVLYKEQDNE